MVTLSRATLQHEVHTSMLHPSRRLALLLALLGLLLEAASALELTESSVAVFTHGDTARELITGKRGWWPCYRIPSLIAAGNGTMLAFAECRSATYDDCFPDGVKSHQVYNRSICMRRSTDAGRTWQEIVSLTPVGDHATQPMAVYAAHTDTTVLQFSLGPPKSAHGRVAQMISLGLTWTPPSFIDRHLGAACWSGQHGQNPLRPGPGRGTQLRSGRIVMNGYIANVSANPASDFGIHVCVWFSDNSGKTWNVSRTFVQHASETQITQVGDGRLFLASRTAPNGVACAANYCRGVAYSSDQGEHFSPLVGDPHLTQPHSARGGGCQGSVLGIGNRTFFSSPAANTNRSKMSIRLSVDGTREWSQPREVYGGGSAYSCLSEVPLLGMEYVGLLYEREAAGCTGPACQVAFVTCRANLSDCGVPA